MALGLLTFVNCYSVRWSMNVANVFTFAKLLAVFVIIIFGFANIIQGQSLFFSFSPSSQVKRGIEAS